MNFIKQMKRPDGSPSSMKKMSRPDGSLRFVNLEYHPSDSRIRIVDYDVAQTLNSRMGTGGGNVPLILEIRDEFDSVGCPEQTDIHA